MPVLKPLSLKKYLENCERSLAGCERSRNKIGAKWIKREIKRVKELIDAQS